jgi:hypothetical protein
MRLLFLIGFAAIIGCDPPQQVNSRALTSRPAGADTLPYYAETASLAPCPNPPVDTTGWQNVGGSGFRFRIPPRFEQQQVQGIDSEVGSWQRDSTSFSFDQGQYSNDLTYLLSRVDSLSMCRFQTGSRTVRVAIYREAGRYLAAAYMPDIVENDHLTLYFVGGSVNDRKQALAAFQTLQLKNDDAVRGARRPQRSVRW